MEDNFITIMDYSQTTVVLTEKVRRLSLHFGSAAYVTTPESVELLQVRSVSFIGLLGCMPSVAEFKLVRVMILHIFSEDVDKRFSLAKICKLFHLRYVQVRCKVTVELPNEMQCLKHLETLEINAGVEYVPSDIVHLSRLRHVSLGEKIKRTPGQVEGISSVDWSWLPCSSTSLESFELLHPICMFSILPQWFLHMHKLRILEIMVKKLWNNIDVLAELPVLKHLSLYVRTPPTAAIILSTGMLPAVEYFKFACGVLSLGFQKGTLPNLRRLKLVFNAHRGACSYSNMLVGIEHLLKLQKVAGSIGLAPGAEESDRLSVESAFSDAITQHPCHRCFEEVVKRVDPVDEDWDQQEESSNERGQVPLRSLHQSIQEADVLPPLNLVFAKQLKLPIFTKNKLVDIENNPIEIQLMDTRTNSVIGPPDTHLGSSSSVRLEVLVLDGDFQCEDRDVWTTDQFNAAIVKAREGKRPLLVGSLIVPMNNHGVAVIDDVSFTENSSWIRCRKFRIGVRIMPGGHRGLRVKEAVSGSFSVKDHRGEIYKKHYPPLLTDNIWRLKNIGKDGPVDKILESEGVRNVQDFLKLHTMDPEKLKALVGMSDRPWNATLTHAKTCDMGRKCYVYKTKGCDITLNPVGEVLAARIGDQTFAVQELHPHQLFHMKQLATQAYQVWDQLEEVANEMPLATNNSFVPTSNSGRQPSDSEGSMISSGSPDDEYRDCIATATSSAAAMSPNSRAPECDFSWQDSAGCWNQVD